METSSDISKELASDLASMQMTHGTTAPFRLLDLPNEIVYLIVDWLWATKKSSVHRESLKALRLTSRRFANDDHVTGYVCRHICFVASPLHLEELQDHDFSRLENAVREVTFIPTDFDWTIPKQAAQFSAREAGARNGLYPPDKKGTLLSYQQESKDTEQLYVSGVFTRAWGEVLKQLKRVDSFPMAHSGQLFKLHRGKYIWGTSNSMVHITPAVWAQLLTTALKAIAFAGISPRSLGLGYFQSDVSSSWVAQPGLIGGLLARQLDLSRLAQLDIATDDFGSVYSLLSSTADHLTSLRIRDTSRHVRYQSDWQTEMTPPPVMPRLERLTIRGFEFDGLVLGNWITSLSSLTDMMLEKAGMQSGRYFQWAYVCRALHDHDNRIHVGLSDLVVESPIARQLLIPSSGWHWGHTPGAAQRLEQDQGFWDQLEDWLQRRSDDLWTVNDFKTCCRNI
ncbi:hypothetical protein TruAng_010828 [Truncatella angustata]|nr:hypothetical protein TruAng_010828 [Truncatella angustata]